MIIKLIYVMLTENVHTRDLMCTKKTDVKKSRCFSYTAIDFLSMNEPETNILQD